MRGERISLHELTALRVDMMGERARQPMPRSRKQASGGRDSRGNVVATRAFKVRKRTLDATKQETENQEESTEADEPKKKRRRRGHYIPDLLPFLHPPGVAEETTQIGADSNGDEDLPSSDLLKSIHYFASCYYDEHGMLTAAARKAKSARRLRNASKRNVDPNQDQHSTTDSETEGEVSTGPRRRLRSSVAPHKNKAKSLVTFINNTSPRKDARQAQSSSRNVNDKDLANSTKSKDMFRAFDGSTLLLIGMLVQSHVKSRLDRRPPPLKDWEDNIRQEEELIEKRSRRGRKKRTAQSGPTEEANPEGEQEVDDQMDSEDKSDDEDSLIHRLVDQGDDSEEEKSDFNLRDSSKESGSE